MTDTTLPTWATLTTEFERQTVLERLALCEGNVSLAARSLDLSIPGFLAIRRRLGIPLNPPCRKGRKASRRPFVPISTALDIISAHLEPHVDYRIDELTDPPTLYAF